MKDSFEFFYDELELRLIKNGKIRMNTSHTPNMNNKNTPLKQPTNFDWFVKKHTQVHKNNIRREWNNIALK